MREWREFTPRKKYLLCVDSDGCVIDSMTVKHRECFGPAVVEIWGREASVHHQEILDHWNRMNLYSLKRGINRFQGLLLELENMRGHGWLQEDLTALREWVVCSGELSNRALEAEAERTKDPVVRKALQWSKLVNCKVKRLAPEKKRAFPAAGKMLREARRWADVCVVSSANREAVLEEWKENALLELADVILTQECGTKEACLRKCMEAGYGKDYILMVGDAPGDLRAAASSGVLFFGIRAGDEENSWMELGEEAAEQIRQGIYRRNFMELRQKEFLENLAV